MNLGAMNRAPTDIAQCLLEAMTTSLKPTGRTLEEFQPLKPAEQKLLEACREGTVAHISDERPKDKTEDNTVRAAFLRFLALGGDEEAPVHEHGVQLIGAWIEGELDMKAAKVPFGLTIRVCHFDCPPVFRGARIQGTLNLGDCQFPGFDGDRLACNGDLILDSCTSSGEVLLDRVKIDGELSCERTQFLARFYALSLKSATIKGSVTLDHGYIPTGKVKLVGVRISKNLSCYYMRFGHSGFALSLEGSVVEGVFFFAKLHGSVGVFLAVSHVGHLADNEESWGRSYLDGFTYNSFVLSPTAAARRLAWLDKQSEAHSGLSGDGVEFKPQPWRQLAKVLREMGHVEDARQVSIAFEHRLRKANLIGQAPKEWGEFRSWLYRKVSRGGHWLFWVLTGYGYRPLRLLGWMFGMWLLCAGVYWYAAVAQSVFAPSDPLIFQNEAYKYCRPDYVASQPASSVPASMQGAGNWYLCSELREEYSGFSPLAYSLDVILPLVDLQQESAWAPLIPTPKDAWYRELFAVFDWKHVTRLVLWFEILFGWVSSLLLVAVVSGLTKRREE
ncbi:MAG: hypothetical protein M0P59_11675 [Gallionella sp.]|jgi:hypothetical protein|nr:hypothetical protein [Gallionella sp.]MCK9354802.1 hypothetical protein [Gallionella sp.]